MAEKKNRANDNLVEDLIVVYLLTSDPRSKRSRNLHQVFSDSIFDFHAISSNSKDGQDDDKAMKVSLQHAQKHYPGKSIIILKDSSKSVLNSWEMARAAVEINNKGNWDFCYLCTWMDVCEKYVNFHRLPGTSIDMVRSYSPEGFQAVMISPHGQRRLSSYFSGEYKKSVEQFLSEHITKENFVAYRTLPNLINYDISLAKTEDDFRKANSCKLTPAKNKKGKGYLVTPTGNVSTGMSLWIFVIVVIIILIVAGVIYWNNRQSKANQTPVITGPQPVQPVITPQYV